MFQIYNFQILACKWNFEKLKIPKFQKRKITNFKIKKVEIIRFLKKCVQIITDQVIVNTSLYLDKNGFNHLKPLQNRSSTTTTLSLRFLILINWFYIICGVGTIGASFLGKNGVFGLDEDLLVILGFQEVGLLDLLLVASEGLDGLDVSGESENLFNMSKCK